jgi:hypothetical protein
VRTTDVERVQTRAAVDHVERVEIGAKEIVVAASTRREDIVKLRADEEVIAHRAWKHRHGSPPNIVYRWRRLSPMPPRPQAVVAHANPIL